MRGQTPIRPAKWVWPAGHLLSLRRERRQRGARGQPPWKPRMVLSAFFLGKPPQRGLLNHPLYKIGAAALGIMVVIHLWICPLGGSPYFINAGCGIHVAADFHKKKIGRQSGGRRKPPGAFLPTFAALGKSGWPRMGYPFSLGQRFICADKLQYALQNGSGLLATSFLCAEKGGKEAPGVNPLGNPGWFCRLSF